MGQVPAWLARRALGLVAALGTVALVSLAIGIVAGRTTMANLSMLYLIAVLVTAVTFGRTAAIVASVAAFLTFNWFFVDPLHTFTVASPDEWVALLLFLATATSTGQLAALLRRRAEESRRREHEAVVLFDVSRLTAETDLSAALPAIAERIRAELGLAAVVVDLGPVGRADAGDAAALEVARATVGAPGGLLKRGAAPTTAARGKAGRWVRIVPPPGRADREAVRRRIQDVPIRTGEQRLGVLRLVASTDNRAHPEAENRLLAAVAALLGQAVERERLRREATEAEILRRTDELRTALLNAVSHDLRTPLASIIASAGSLLQRDVDWTEAERREFAEAIESEARRLNSIVGNLLDLSRMEAGALRPEMGWYDLGALVDDVVGRLRPVTAHHRLVVEVPDDLPPVRLDYVEIDQVLSNLIENAVRYTPPGTEIGVRVRPRLGAVEVEVADRGPGIAPEALPRLFEPFYRAPAAGVRPRGTGLGLAVARGLVEAHGGTIRAENRPDGGARFVFSLPVDLAPIVPGPTP